MTAGKTFRFLFFFIGSVPFGVWCTFQLFDYAIANEWAPLLVALIFTVMVTLIAVLATFLAGLWNERFFL